MAGAVRQHAVGVEHSSLLLDSKGGQRGALRDGCLCRGLLEQLHREQYTKISAHFSRGAGTAQLCSTKQTDADHLSASGFCRSMHLRRVIAGAARSPRAPCSALATAGTDSIQIQHLTRTGPVPDMTDSGASSSRVLNIFLNTLTLFDP